MFFDQSNNFKLEGNSTAGIVEDALRIQHMGHVLAVRWKEIREKVSLTLFPFNLYNFFFLGFKIMIFWYREIFPRAKVISYYLGMKFQSGLSSKVWDLL